VIADTPSNAGTAQLITDSPTPLALAVTEDGELGLLAVAAVVAEDASEIPSALVAVTVNV
jgi:hypothetical protein